MGKEKGRGTIFAYWHREINLAFLCATHSAGCSNPQLLWIFPFSPWPPHVTKDPVITGKHSWIYWGNLQRQEPPFWRCRASCDPKSPHQESGADHDSGPAVATATLEVPNEKSVGNAMNWIVNSPWFPCCHLWAWKAPQGFGSTEEKPRATAWWHSRRGTATPGRILLHLEEPPHGRLLLQSFLGSQALILRDKIVGKKKKKIRNQDFK